MCATFPAPLMHPLTAVFPPSFSLFIPLRSKYSPQHPVLKHPLCFSCSSCRWGEIISLNCDHQRVYCSFPRWYTSMERHDRMIMTGENQRTRRKNLSLCHIVSHKSYVDCPGREPGPPRWKAGD
jgi:hypothetical protein